MEQGNIGIYSLCRILSVGDKDYFQNEAKHKALRHLAVDQKEYTLYMDEVKLGETSNRSELDRLFQDAKDGKIGHIVIADVLDLWHSPQKIYEMVQQVKSSNPATVIQAYPTSGYWSLRNPVPFDDWENSLILNVLHAARTVNDLTFVYDNYKTLDKRVRNIIISRSIDPEMIEDYLVSFYLESRNMESDEFARQIGIEGNSIDLIVDCWRPNIKQQDMMIEIFGKELIAFYLA